MWTDKCRLHVEEIWPGRALAASSPTHLLRVVQDHAIGDIRVRPLTRTETLSTLMRQKVIPTHRETARPILDVPAKTAGAILGAEVRVGRDAYRDAELLSVLEEAVR